MSAASAAKAASSGFVPGSVAPSHSRVRTITGVRSPVALSTWTMKRGSSTERISICPMGTTKVTSTKARSGATSRNARRLALAWEEASAALSGRPSAVRRAPSAAPPAVAASAACGSAGALKGAFRERGRPRRRGERARARRRAPALPAPPTGRGARRRRRDPRSGSGGRPRRGPRPRPRPPRRVGALPPSPRRRRARRATRRRVGMCDDPSPPSPAAARGPRAGRRPLRGKAAAASRAGCRRRG